MRRLQVLYRQPPRQAIDGSHPAMHASLHEQSASRLELLWQCIQDTLDQRLIVQIAERQGVAASQQPPEHTIAPSVVPGAFVVDATAIKRITHEPCIGDVWAPERTLEQER